jgi:PAS domain S-box-containing protein
MADEASKQPRIPGWLLRLLNAAVALTVVVFLGVVLLVQGIHDELNATLRSHMDMELVARDTVVLAERCSDAALMAAQTGDRQWVSRFVDTRALAEEALENSVLSAPSEKSRAFARTSNEGGRKVLAMEAQAIDRVEAGQRAEALALLQSSLYLEKRTLAVKNALRFQRTGTTHLSRRLRSVRNKLFWSQLLGLILVWVTLGLWFVVVRSLRLHYVSLRGTEMALRLSSDDLETKRRELRFLIENAGDFVYRVGSEDAFEYISPAIEHVLGYTVEKWAANHLNYITGHSMNQEFRDRSRGWAVGSGASRSYLVEVRHADGHLITMELHERPYAEHGGVGGIVGVGRDVTDRAKAEDVRMGGHVDVAPGAIDPLGAVDGVETFNLARTQCLARALEGSADAVVITAPDGAIEYVNAAFTMTTGYASSEVVGETAHMLLASGDRDAFGKRMQEARGLGEPWAGRLLHERPNGESYWVDATLSPIRDEKGRITAWVDVLRDITDEVDRERRFERAKLFHRMSARVTRRLRRDLSPIVDRCGAALDLLVELASQPEHRMASVFVHRGDSFHELARHGVSSLGVVQGRVPARAIQKIKVCDAKDHANVGPHGHLVVPLLCEDRLQGSLVVFTTADAVIEDQEAELLGEVAEQIAYALAAEEVQETPSLARKAAEGPSQAKTDIAVPAGARGDADVPEEVPQRLKVLVAEDNAVNRLLIRRILELEGASVDTVDNGRQAVDKVTSTGSFYDLVMMDLRMPEMDGFEATQALRERGFDGTIIALTADVMDGARERAMKAGCDDFETKPIDRERLIKTLRRFTAGRS